jgi:hypothetical protein
VKWPPAAVASRTITRAYCMHGVGIVVEATDPGLISRIDRRLAMFKVGRDEAETTLRFHFHAPDGAEGWDMLPPTERTVYEVGGVEFRYSETTDQVVVFAGDRPVALCDPSRGETHLRLGDGSAEDLELQSQTLFTICLLEHMKRLGRFGLHAAGVNIGGAGLLIAGPSGVGKSTVTVLLLKAMGVAAGFLGDDMLFLRSAYSGLVALGWPEPIDVARWTQLMVPGLGSEVREPELNGRKGRVAASAMGAGPAFEAVPAVIVLPRITGQDRSTVTPLSPDEALFEIAPNVLLTEAGSSQAHLGALASLARSCPCYRLEAGRDLDRLPHVLLGLM